MRARGTIAFAVAAVGLLFALPTAAQETDELDPADRALVHAYSAEAMQLLWATVMGEAETAETECGVAEGDTVTYEVDEEGNVTITPETDGEIEPSENCEFHETDVQGPEGQVNHGTVISNFVNALEEEGLEGGRGCYVRAIAQSDYGKGDEQVQVPDVEPANDENGDETVSIEDVEFTITETTCNGSNDESEASSQASANGKGQVQGNSQGGSGKPDWAGNGPPPHAKGKGR